jgi:hypothetical protein
MAHIRSRQPDVRHGEGRGQEAGGEEIKRYLRRINPMPTKIEVLDGYDLEERGSLIQRDAGLPLRQDIL